MLAVVGDSCVDRYLPPVDRTTAGGNALNVAANLAGRGHRTAYVGVVGEDADGRLIRQAAAAAGLDLRHLFTAAGVTGVCMVRLSRDGERVFLSEKTGVSGGYRPPAEAVEFLDGCDWVHAAGLAVGEPLLPRLRSRRLSNGILDPRPHLGDEILDLGAADHDPGDRVEHVAQAVVGEGDRAAMRRSAVKTMISTGIVPGSSPRRRSTRQRPVGPTPAGIADARDDPRTTEPQRRETR